MSGSALAPVTLLEFGDFECSYCARFSREVLPPLRRQYVDSGKLRIVFVHLPLKSIHPLARTAAEYGACADVNGLFWDYHDDVFSLQVRGLLDRPGLDLLAKSRGVDVDRRPSCTGAAPLAVEADVKLARELGVVSTPTVALGLTEFGGRVVIEKLIRGLKPVSDYQSAIELLLSRTPANQDAIGAVK